MELPSAGGEIEDRLNFFHWAEYDDPEVFKDFENEFGATTKIDIYASNEEAIAKLTAASGTSGYDLVIPTGVYIPQMVELDLLEEINLDLIPNFENVDEIYRDQPWDPGNKYSVVQGLGLDRVDLRQDPGVERDQHMERLPRGRRGRGERARRRSWTRRAT